MIELQTGVPGSGKTQYTLYRVEQLRRKTSRPVFYSGIPLDPGKLPGWQSIEATDWYKCPPESIVIIDEAQRIFRPRPAGSAVPEFESHLETHRHYGIDLILITQHPRLLSVGVRSLAGRHLHAVRHFGLELSTIHEWASCHMNVDSRVDSVKHRFKFRKEVYSWYKSAEAHTQRRQIPIKVWVLLLLPIVILSLVAFAWFYVKRHYYSGSAPPSSSHPAALTAPPGAPARASSGSSSRVDLAEYLRSYRPRVVGLPWSAPGFDEVTKPTRAPYPAACISGPRACRCYSQDATLLDIPSGLCHQIALHGFFKHWDDPSGRERGFDRRATVASEALPPAASVPAAYGDPAGLVHGGSGGVLIDGKPADDARIARYQEVGTAAPAAGKSGGSR